MSVESGRLLVLAAMRQELGPLLRAVEGGRRLPVDGIAGREGTLAGRAVTLVWSGEGAARARGCARRLFEERPGEVLIVGVAGALSPGLEVGTLLVAERVVAGSRTLAPRDDQLEAARRESPLVVATLLTVDRIVVSDADRARLAAMAGASTAVAVDMETAAFAEAAEAAGRRWLAVRVVSDAVGDRLPPFLERCRRPDGSIDRLRVALEALRAPGSVPRLWTLSRRVGDGARQLAAFARRWAVASPVAEGTAATRREAIG